MEAGDPATVLGAGEMMEELVPMLERVVLVNMRDKRTGFMEAGGPARAIGAGGMIEERVVPRPPKSTYET
jgi:hypothetical protein